jgi:thermostable 8-oxoguanine DNA glycosylase
MQKALHICIFRQSFPAMSQTFFATYNDGREVAIQMPDASEEVIPGVPWGRFDRFFTPAFWFARAWYGQQTGGYSRYRLGNTLREEIVACLLGGHGMPAEVGLAAFARLRERGLLGGEVSSESEFHKALVEPLSINGRSIRYRYPNQRAKLISKAIIRLDQETPPHHDDLAFREWLLRFDGIGLKTASWVTRNFLDSQNVAILDVHIFRAGVLAGVFSLNDSIQSHYLRMEERFLRFTRSLGVDPAMFDTLIWYEMRQMASLALEAMDDHAGLKSQKRRFSHPQIEFALT